VENLASEEAISFVSPPTNPTDLRVSQILFQWKFTLRASASEHTSMCATESQLLFQRKIVREHEYFFASKRVRPHTNAGTVAVVEDV
jgi:hypothetical protein